MIKRAFDMMKKGNNYYIIFILKLFNFKLNFFLMSHIATTPYYH